MHTTRTPTAMLDRLIEPESMLESSSQIDPLDDQQRDQHEHQPPVVTPFSDHTNIDTATTTTTTTSKTDTNDSTTTSTSTTTTTSTTTSTTATSVITAAMMTRATSNAVTTTNMTSTKSIITTTLLTGTNTLSCQTKAARPLSISSISSAASSNSSSSAASSSSSGIQSSLTRNSSLNYGHPIPSSSGFSGLGRQRPRRASAKLQQSPSSVSSHSNTSSLFRDDGFEDDLTSTASEHSSSIVFQHQQRTAPALFYHNQLHHHLHLHHNHHQREPHIAAYQHSHHLHCLRPLEGEISSPTITQRVVTEIIETERSYVDDLEKIVTGYLCYLRDVLEQHSQLFSNLEDIHKFNKDFLFQLEECYLNPGAVAACFVENALKFDVYTHYCTMYPQVVSTLTQLMSEPDSAQLLKERQLELNQSLPLGAYLLKPVQRILKYHILFKSLIEHTTEDETVSEKERESINEAFSVMTNIACHINEMKKKHEYAIRVQELQGLLYGWEGPDLTTLGELILEDTFKLCNRQKSTRHLFLFDNVLLITKKKHDGSFCYKGHIECTNLMLIENIDGQPLAFQTVPFDNPKALCAFQADNVERKRDWCLQMKEVIIKSFEVKIPTHVRDLLMSLTKSNSAGDAKSSAALKSSSSESAKSVRAPNYLEKKRNKQDKKK